MMRQLRHRDRGCTFPGCAATRWTQAHHIRWWSRGGTTDLDNLVLTCLFHHKLVHEYGWTICRERAGDVIWRRPDGTRYHAGPAPPQQVA
ncbi:MAG TPA: HNH endonuclease [Actinomycetota bacterium]